MDRDSKTESIWQSDSPPFVLGTEVNTKRIYDVLVAGAGITGLTTGLLLQRAGKKCIIAEAKSIGFGTTSASTAHLNTLLDTHYCEIKKKFGLPAAILMARGAKEAIKLVQNNVEQFNIACDFKIVDAFLFSENDQQSQYLEEVFWGVKEAGLKTIYVNQIPVPFPFKKAINLKGQAQFNPLKYLYGLVQAFEAAGGVIIQDALVNKRGVKDYEDYSVVPTGNKEIKAKNIVYATHIPPGLDLLHFENTPYRSYVLAAQLEDDNYPEDLVYDMRVPYNYFRSAIIKNTKYLLAGGFDHKTGHEKGTKEIFAEIKTYLKKHYKIKSVDFQWSSQYYQPADGLPYIGNLPGAIENTYVATGFSGTGMTLGTLAGKILCDLITTGKSEFEDLLSPSRKKATAGFEKIIQENADAVKHFIGDRASLEEMKATWEIHRNEGKVVTYKGRKYALYKDVNGAIMALNPVCPHAKCLVQWNDAEKSWDCPCHGSRFGIDGSVLNGPALEPLQKIILSN